MMRAGLNAGMAFDADAGCCIRMIHRDRSHGTNLGTDIAEPALFMIYDWFCLQKDGWSSIFLQWCVIRTDWSFVIRQNWRQKVQAIGCRTYFECNVGSQELQQRKVAVIRPAGTEYIGENMLRDNSGCSDGMKIALCEFIPKLF